MGIEWADHALKNYVSLIWNAKGINMHTYKYIHIYTNTHINIYKYLHIYVSIHIYIHIYTNICIYIYTYMYISMIV
jgi:hypothetical protein